MSMKQTLCEFVHGMTCEEVCRFVGGIVRCRDCIYYAEDPEPIDPGWPMMFERTGDDMVEPYGYCAWAVKRTEGGEWTTQR